jgi:hypothetical protein
VSMPLAAECRFVLADCNCRHLLSRDDWRKARYRRQVFDGRFLLNLRQLLPESRVPSPQFPLLQSSFGLNRDRNTNT